MQISTKNRCKFIFVYELEGKLLPAGIRWAASVTSAPAAAATVSHRRSRPGVPPRIRRRPGYAPSHCYILNFCSISELITNVSEEDIWAPGPLVIWPIIFWAIGLFSLISMGPNLFTNRLWRCYSYLVRDRKTIIINLRLKKNTSKYI